MLRKDLLVGKAKYDGPKNLPMIVEQIQKDIGDKVTREFILRVIGSMFSEYVIGKMLKSHEAFSLHKIGRFSIRKDARVRRAEQAKERIEKYRITKRKRENKYKVKYQIMQRLKKINAHRAESGLEPIEFKEFLDYRYPHIDRKKYNMPR